MAVQGQDEHRDWLRDGANSRPTPFRCSFAPHIGAKEQRKLDRLDRVLERGVVELHHVLVVSPAPCQAAGQVDVDDVEAA